MGKTAKPLDPTITHRLQPECTSYHWLFAIAYNLVRRVLAAADRQRVAETCEAGGDIGDIGKNW